MRDAMETIGNSLIQHDAENDRAYLVKLHPSDASGIIGNLEQLACSRGYSKICAKVPAWEAGRFVAAGFYLEATVPYFFPEGGAACFLAKYLSDDRKRERQPLLVKNILVTADAQQRAAAMPLPGNFVSRTARKEDAAQVAELYGEVFSHERCATRQRAGIRATFEAGNLFLGIWNGEHLVAASAAEIDAASNSAELSDFAVLPQYRGHGFSLHLLQQMEAKLLALGLRLVFAVTRAYSLGMNATFARNGYSFGGTLTNHTQISGSLESMNVWHKALPEDPRIGWSSVFTDRRE